MPSSARKTPPTSAAARKAAAPAPATKTAAKAVSKAVSKAVAKQPTRRAAPAAVASKPAPKAEPAKAAKPPKLRIKLVRDSFAMPEADFALIAALKARAIDAKRPAKKSELLRAGLQALATLPPAGLAAALEALTPIRTGRPKKGH